MRQRESAGSRRLLIILAAGYISLFLLLPVGFVFAQAFAGGWRTCLRAFSDPAALSALKLTFLAAGVAVPLNLVFGVAAAWAIAKFEFSGKSLLVAFIDLPLSVSPVISGMGCVLVFGLQGWLGPWLARHGWSVVFAAPAVVLVTIFVTLPLVARELIPLMAERGTDDEEAAVLLGADGWQTFTRVTLPGIKWGLLYGAVLCAARAVGEFGAVSVVSGRIRGRTDTLTLHVENLYNEYQLPAAFAVASLLALVALATLALQYAVDRRRAGAEETRS